MRLRPRVHIDSNFVPAEREVGFTLLISRWKLIPLAIKNGRREKTLQPLGSVYAAGTADVPSMAA